MPFGLLNALASFQKYNKKIPADKSYIFDMIYPDTVRIYTNIA